MAQFSLMWSLECIRPFVLTCILTVCSAVRTWAKISMSSLWSCSRLLAASFLSRAAITPRCSRDIRRRLCSLLRLLKECTYQEKGQRMSITTHTHTHARTHTHTHTHAHTHTHTHTHARTRTHTHTHTHTPVALPAG